MEGDTPEPRLGKLEGFAADLHRIFQENPESRAMTIFRRLKEAGYQGSYDLVKRKVRTLRAEATGEENPVLDVPGLRAEVDLGKVRITVPSGSQADGNPRQVRDCFLFSMTLRYSGRIYAELLAQPEMDAFLECHRRAFAFFQGVPREVAYERHRNKWLRRLAGSTRFNLPVMRLADHFGFHPKETPPAAPWAAGRLKRPLRMIDAGFLRGYPLESLEGANVALLGWLAAREGMSDSGDGPTAQEKFLAEKADLAPLPRVSLEKYQPKLISR